MSIRGLLVPAWLLAMLLLQGVPAAADAQGTVEKIYADNCAACHGMAGNGDGAKARSLKSRPHSFADCDWMSMMSDATLFLVITKGGAAAGLSPDMPAYKSQLSGGEVTALLARVRQSCKNGG